MRMLRAAIAKTNINLLYKYPPLPKPAELCGTPRIETFINHGFCYLILSRSFKLASS